MKTNILFKNTLSLLTLGLVVFSCAKPTEGPKTEEDAKADIQKAIANIKSIAFTKYKNSVTGNTSATETYAALFIKKTPALAYTDKSYDKFEARIEADGVIKVLVPFDKTLDISTAATLKATITFNGKIGPNIYLGDSTTPLDSTITSFDYDITTELIHSKLIKPEGISHSFKLSRKEKDSNPIEKVFKIVFVHDKPSKDCTIGPDDFKFTVADTGINTITNLTPVGTGAVTPTSNSTIKAHYVAPTESDKKDGTEAKPFEFQLRKSTSGKTPGELKENGVVDTDYFKADALKLPNGAFIEVDATTTACSGTDCNNVNPITGIKSGGTASTTTTDLKGASSNAKIEYKFTVVAQDGVTKKHYKLTINAEAPVS
ncbi:hypothetical protein [Ichthyobacterium seriolicida]|uniref:Lipoprotein n=1 Tax=Ichthyobacterium seriolicida TaxID=242600 RepID=A0A1J1E7X4_9FLAO|nr:hypothetical protein [Ichthyobacterium seriolicida]BAV94027.1 hypothetical protein JBKA6_0014 [Ichthyobacterium seriolicida]